MARKVKRKTLVRKLDKIFSQYIRERDTNSRGYGKCCTSGKTIHKSNGHAGHFISRRFMCTRWDEENVHLQSAYDNTFLAGRQYEYALFINKKYHADKATELLIKSRETCKFSIDELQDMIENYKTLLEKL
tara:strand:+ start:28 stop:420 length:393 start_codon:yes stop_codon:yes gene_type:complete